MNSPVPYTKLQLVRHGHHDDDEETACGVGRCRPRGLQSFATIGWFAACNGAAYLMTSCVTSFFNSQLTTIERQFGFTSSQTGLILATSHISYILCVLFISYLGNHLHIPKSLCIGTFMFGLSGIICALPHFVFGGRFSSELTISSTNFSHTSRLGQHSESATALRGQLCQDGAKTDKHCDSTGGDNSSHLSALENSHNVVVSLGIIVVGMLVQGLGKGPRFSFAVTYVDNNTDRQNTGFYTGIMITCSVLGPVVSFVAGAIFNQIPVTLQKTHLDPKHPGWIGAWWLGYLLLGIVTILASLPLILFPRHLPRDSSKVKPHPLQPPGAHENSYRSTKSCRITLGKVVTYITDFLRCQARLWTNPVFTLINLCSTCIVFSISSQSFIPKYLETQFDMSAAEANYVMASRSLIANSLGTFLGGYLTRRLRMSGYQALKFTLLLLILSCICTYAALFFYCEQPVMYNMPSTVKLVCSAGCDCTDNSFFPVCGRVYGTGDAGMQTFYSPCFAGCREVSSAQSQSGYIYTSCACLPAGGSATSGVCPYRCSSLYPYVFFSAITSFLQTMTIIPRVVIFIRCVSEADKSAAIGLQSFTNSFLGYLSGGLIFGSLIDSVCSVWDFSCEVRGHCVHYDNELFRVKLHQTMLVPLVMATLCAGLAYRYCRRTQSLNDVEENVIANDKQS